MRVRLFPELEYWYIHNYGQLLYLQFGCPLTKADAMRKKVEERGSTSASVK